MKTIMLLLASFGFASCIPDPQREFLGPNGKIVASIGCSEWGQTMGDCEKQTAEVCPTGYKTIHLASGADDVSKRGGLGGVPAQKLTIECM